MVPAPGTLHTADTNEYQLEATIGDVNKISNSILSGSGLNDDPLAPNHPLGGLQSGSTICSQPEQSFRPAPLEIIEGKANTGLYIPVLQVTMNNIEMLKSATLEESGMAPDDIDRLRDLGSAHCILDMSDTHLVKAL